jgi:hypothetical protein
MTLWLIRVKLSPVAPRVRRPLHLNDSLKSKHLDSFESLIAALLRRDGYWTNIGVKVELTRDEKRAIDSPSAPRWELDVVAYHGGTNELLVVECKSFLDSAGVTFRNQQFEPADRYKLFSNEKTRKVVLEKLATQLVHSLACAKNPKVILCLATGKIASKTDRQGLKQHFDRQGWRLFDEDWVFSRLKAAETAGYENDVAHIVAKLIFRRKAVDDAD